jgi:hypothetical protein
LIERYNLPCCAVAYLTIGGTTTGEEIEKWVSKFKSECGYNGGPANLMAITRDDGPGSNEERTEAKLQQLGFVHIYSIPRRSTYTTRTPLRVWWLRLIHTDHWMEKGTEKVPRDPVTNPRPDPQPAPPPGPLYVAPRGPGGY